MYEVTIKEIKTEKKMMPGNFTVVDERPYTEQELNNAYSGFLNSYLAKKGAIKEIRDYAPPVEKDVEIEHEIYRQRVEVMEFQEVIKAINGIV
jgi:hypothetical protein